MTRATTLPISGSINMTMEKVLIYESNSSLRATEIAEHSQIHHNQLYKFLFCFCLCLWYNTHNTSQGSMLMITWR